VGIQLHGGGGPWVEVEVDVFRVRAKWDGESRLKMTVRRRVARLEDQGRQMNRCSNGAAGVYGAGGLVK
jgi:hypothetical protein